LVITRSRGTPGSDFCLEGDRLASSPGTVARVERS
jgi:hypothetical protein